MALSVLWVTLEKYGMKGGMEMSVYNCIVIRKKELIGTCLLHSLDERIL